MFEPAGDLVLHSEQIGGVAVEPLRPEMGVGCRIDQLSADPDLAAGPPDAAFEYIAHAELAADLLCVDRLALVGERGVALNHQAALDAGEIGGQILGDAIGKIFLLRFIAKIGERQHHNRQPRSGLRLQTS